MDKIKKIISQIQIWKDWKESYKKFVPRFIDEAKTKSRWQDWDKDIFYEYFERSEGQCVSSLKQGYFSNQEKEKIKQNWEIEIAPILKKIAESQETLWINLYRNLDNAIRQHTSQHKRAAVNRLIAGLQPKILCTIVNPKDLNNAKKLINNLLPKDKKIKDKDYFEISNKVIELIKKIYPNDNVYDLVTIPWQLYEILSNKQIIEKEEDMNLENTFDLLKYKKQIILQGPPGTGKTREAKQIAKALLNIAEDENLKNSEQFQIIQFHPSYSYEDFVRGIVAKPKASGITYEAEDKILTKFAKKAWKNPRTKDPLWLAFKNHLLQYQLLGKELYFSENVRFKDIYYPDTDNPMLRYEYCYDGKNWSMQTWIDIRDMLVNTNSFDSEHQEVVFNYAKKYRINLLVRVYSNKNFVLIIDEINRANLSSVLGELIYALEYRGEAVDSMYEVDGSNKIILPPNLYIIGTMNTADRSVGHIDYAIRRRFAFVDVLPKDLSEEVENFNRDLFYKVASLFDNHLSQEFKKEEVQLGHSYFITENTDIQTRLEYEIKPILREYVKDGVLKESASDEIEKL